MRYMPGFGKISSSTNVPSGFGSGCSWMKYVRSRLAMNM
jgi:hypothetical protein